MADTKKTKKTTQAKHRPGGKTTAAKRGASKARRPKSPDDSIRPHLVVREDLLLAAREKGERTGLGQKSVPHIVRIGLTKYVQNHKGFDGQVLPVPLQIKLRALAEATKDPEQPQPRAIAHEFNAYLAAVREAGFSLANLGPFLDVSRQRIHQRADAGEARAKKLQQPLPHLEVAPAGQNLPQDTPQVDRSFPMKRGLYDDARRVSHARGEALSDVVDEILYSYVNGDLEVTTRRARTMDLPETNKGADQAPKAG